MKRLAPTLTLSAATALALILPAAARGQARPGPSVVAGFASDRNLFASDTEDAAKFYLNGKIVSFREWRRMSGTTAVLVADPRGRVRRAAAQR